MTHHERVTFTTGQEVIDHGIRYLAAICDVLETLRGQKPDERVAMLLTSVETEQRNLLGALQRFREDTPAKVRETYFQYTVELPPPDAIVPPPGPLTTLGLIQWLAQHNGYLQALAAELADKHESEDAAEMFAGIAQQVEAHDRRLSKEYQRFEDL